MLVSKNVFVGINNALDSLSNVTRYYVWNRHMKHRAQGLGPLEKEQVVQINKLYNPYKRISLAAHTFYTKKTDVFSEYYIPDSLWYAYIDPYFNPRRLAKAMDSKFLYSRLLIGDNIIKHPNTIAYRVNGFWVSNDFRPVSIKEIAFHAMEYSAIFIKQSEDSAGGHGVVYYDCTRGLDDLVNMLRSIQTNVVIQEGLCQHFQMSRLNPTSVNTIRVLTHLTLKGQVKVRSVVVRMGRNGSHVDNASSGGITVGVEDFGRLKSKAYDVAGCCYEEHPNSHVKFSEIVIPNYSDMLDEVKLMHWQLPLFRLLSWDIAINQEATPILIEVNMHSGQLDFHQLNNGPVFGEDTKAVLDEVFKK